MCYRGCLKTFSELNRRYTHKAFLSRYFVSGNVYKYFWALYIFTLNYITYIQPFYVHYFPASSYIQYIYIYSNLFNLCSIDSVFPT